MVDHPGDSTTCLELIPEPEITFSPLVPIEPPPLQTGQLQAYQRHSISQEVDRQINELLHLKLIEPSEMNGRIQLFVYPKRTEVSDYVLTTDI
ncbi:hypothetical protein TNCV_4086501 [Trichonephila clavipes]|nr:hypothetical protein TNCV_4086501 [Trichonephila clavipes]